MGKIKILKETDKGREVKSEYKRVSSMKLGFYGPNAKLKRWDAKAGVINVNGFFVITITLLYNGHII